MTEVVLKEQRYGKDRVRLIKVIRTGKWHEVIELTVRNIITFTTNILTEPYQRNINHILTPNLSPNKVRVLLEGDFETSYTHGDNSKVVATDTMKNTVYILAKKTANIKCIELF